MAGNHGAERIMIGLGITPQTYLDKRPTFSTDSDHVYFCT